MLKNQVDILNGCQNANKATIGDVIPFRPIIWKVAAWRRAIA